tara:strand:+ start:161 stop:448 length:288 start_codon:yes stop_codon:yes gene_type:complete
MAEVQTYWSRNRATTEFFLVAISLIIGVFLIFFFFLDFSDLTFSTEQAQSVFEDLADFSNKSILIMILIFVSIFMPIRFIILYRRITKDQKKLAA